MGTTSSYRWLFDAVGIGTTNVCQFDETSDIASFIQLLAALGFAGLNKYIAW
jgi:hypothetical protein